MAGKLELFQDIKPLRLGLDIFHKKPRAMRRRDQIHEFSYSVEESQERAKALIKQLKKDHPEIVVAREELEQFKVEDQANLYEKPTPTILYFSPHMPAHIYSDLILWTSLVRYANKLYKDDPTWTPLNEDSGKLASISHDGSRSEHDWMDTLLRYHKHGRDGARNLERSLARMKKPMPEDPKVEALVKEIDEFHDVDPRPVSKKSPELELFTLVDKLELSRLMRPKLGSYRRFKRVQELAYLGVREVTMLRMRVYEGRDPRIMKLMQQFLPVADALYTLRTQKMREMLEANQGDWSKVDQWEASVLAGEQIGLVVGKKEEKLQQSKEAVTLSQA